MFTVPDFCSVKEHVKEHVKKHQKEQAKEHIAKLRVPMCTRGQTGRES